MRVPLQGMAAMALVWAMALVQQGRSQDTMTGFASSFSNEMVLQRAPQRAVVYGPLESPENALEASVHVRDEIDGGLIHEAPVDVVQDGRAWRSMLPALSPRGGGRFRIDLITAKAGNHSIRNVTFGDVWFCSGQSNMQLIIGKTYSSRTVHEELSDPAFSGPDGSLVRFLGVGGGGSKWGSRHPEFVLRKQPDSGPWQQLGPETPHRALMEMSSTCVYFGIQMRRQLARSDEHRDVPIGLVHAAVGGTMVQAWSPLGVLDTCSEMSRIEKEAQLFNGLVAPFVNTTIAGIMWYQGENNVFESAGNLAEHRGYACALHSMIRAWRALWSTYPETTPVEAPFGIYTLSAGADEGHPDNMAGIRGAQMSVANDLANAFTVHAHDLGDPWPNEKACVKAGCCVPDPSQAATGFIPATECVTARKREALPAYWFEAIDGPWLYGDAPSLGLIHPRNKRRLADRAALAALATWDVSLADAVLSGQVFAPRVNRCSRRDTNGSVLELGLEALARDDDLVIEPLASRVLPDLNIEFCTGNRTSCLCRVWRKASATQWICDDHGALDDGAFNNASAPADHTWHVATTVEHGSSRSSLALTQVPQNAIVHTVRIAWRSTPCCDSASSKAFRQGLAPCFLNCGVYTRAHRLPLAPSFVPCAAEEVSMLIA